MGGRNGSGAATRSALGLLLRAVNGGGEQIGEAVTRYFCRVAGEFLVNSNRMWTLDENLVAAKNAEFLHR